MTLQIEPRTPNDDTAIAALLEAAFDGPDEARLVAALDASGDVALSLVAREPGEIVGHVLFSPLDAQVDGRGVRTLSLAPLAVLPQAQGIGSTLVKAGLARARAGGWAAVIVVGEPAYYGRFGCAAATVGHLDTPYGGPACQGLELQPGALAGAAGHIRYAAPFAELE